MPLCVRPSLRLSVCPSVNFSFPDNSSYSLHPIKLELDIQLDHYVEQRILLRGYSPSNINRTMPFWKIL